MYTISLCILFYVYYIMYTISCILYYVYYLCILYYAYYIMYTILCILYYVYYIMYTILCLCMLPPTERWNHYYNHFNRNCQSIYLFGRDYGLLYTYMAWCKIMVIYFGFSKCLCLKMETWSPSCGIFRRDNNVMINEGTHGYPIFREIQMDKHSVVAWIEECTCTVLTGAILL